VKNQHGDAEVDDKAGHVHERGNEGAEDLAGSMPKRLRMKGSIEPVIVPQSTIPTSEQATVRPISSQCSP
jgi:hypothetical protein